MMKIKTLSLSISVVSLLAALPAVQASELITNCIQVSAAGGFDIDSTPANQAANDPKEDDESCAKVLVPMDFGDAPDPAFPTLREQDGARHQLGTEVYLGQCVDSDLGFTESGTLAGMATADDSLQSKPTYGTCSDVGDEDGVTVGELKLGEAAVPVDIVAHADCKLNAWIDWNADGDWDDTAEQVFTDTDLVAGNNALTLAVPAVATVSDAAYARFRCSSKGGDTTTGEADDGEVEDYKLAIVADVKTPMSVGNFIWMDSDQNGQQSSGEYGLVGSTVTSVTLVKADGTPARDLDNKVVASQTITASGTYLFGNLPEGEYILKVIPPFGYVPTLGGDDADSNPSDTDNNCRVTEQGFQTYPFTLQAGAAPDTDLDGDDANGNLTVDCGFYLPAKPTYSVGNQVWVDDGAGIDTNAGNGLRDADEGSVPDGVQVELRDTDGLMLKQATTKNGFYLFSGLDAGSYHVCVTAANFAAGGVLNGYMASTGGDETNPNLNVDGNDNGDNDTHLGLCSGSVTLGDNEPVNETPTAMGQAGQDGAGTADQRSNLTLDFAVVPPKAPVATVALGDFLWVDRNANGVQDAGEVGLEGARVSLLTAAGAAATDADGKSVTAVTTDASGLYRFGNLLAGDYVVGVAPPANYFLSMGGLDVDEDPDNADSNCVIDKDGLIKTHPVTLTEGTEPDAAQDGDGKNGNMTADCGFYRTVSVGDRIWVDANANGQQDNAESGLAGVTVSITEADGVTPVFDATGQPVAAVTTGAAGQYNFSHLVPGTYTLAVMPGQKGYKLSAGGKSPDTDPSNTDSNCLAIEGGYQTPVFSVFDVTGKGDYINNTVDCGFFRPVGVGSRIWIDLNSDGKQTSGEPGVPGATVTLLTVDGKPATNIYGQLVPSVKTGSNGEYFFGNLREGDYVISVTPPAGYSPTIASANPDNDDATDSNGTIFDNGTVRSAPITLKWGEEPENDGDGDASTNLTIGFGFVKDASRLQIPTVSTWGLGILSLLLSGMAFLRRRRIR